MDSSRKIEHMWPTDQQTNSADLTCVGDGEIVKQPMDPINTMMGTFFLNIWEYPVTTWLGEAAKYTGFFRFQHALTMFKQLGVDPSTFGSASNQPLGIFAFQDTKKRTIESLSAMSVPESLRITWSRSCKLRYKHVQTTFGETIQSNSSSRNCFSYFLGTRSSQALYWLTFLRSCTAPNMPSQAGKVNHGWVVEMFEPNGVSINGCFFGGEILLYKMDDLGVPPFMETPRSIFALLPHDVWIVACQQCCLSTLGIENHPKNPGVTHD